MIQSCKPQENGTGTRDRRSKVLGRRHGQLRCSGANRFDNDAAADRSGTDMSAPRFRRDAANDIASRHVGQQFLKRLSYGVEVVLAVAMQTAWAISSCSA